MIEIAVLLFTAAAAATVSRWISLPSVPLFLFAGWLLTLTGFRVTDDMLTKSLELGVAFLAFASGTALDAKRLREKLGFTAAAVLIQMVVSVGLVFAAARVLGFDPMPAFFLAVAFSVSSTVVGTRQMQRLGQTQEPFARFSSRMLLLQDAAVVIAIALLAASDTTGLGAALGAALGAILLLVAAIGLRSFVSRRLEKARHLDDEGLLLFLLGTLFAFLGVATLLELPVVVGAFCAGLVYSRFPASGMVRGQLTSMTDFFAALFFTTLAQLSTSLTVGLLLEAIGLTALILGSRFLLVFLLARRSGLDGRGATESGLLLSQVGEYGLVIGLIALQSGVFGDREVALVGMVASFTMMVTPLVAHERVASLLLHLWRDRNPLDEAGEWRGHVIMIGYGAGGKWVARPLRDAGIPFVVVDDDPAVIADLRAQGISCVLGNGTDPAVLEAAGVDEAKAVLASPRRVSDGLKVLRHVRRIPVIVRVFEESEAESARELGGIPIRNSLAGAERFLDWFDQRAEPTAGK